MTSLEPAELDSLVALVLEPSRKLSNEPWTMLSKLSAVFSGNASFAIPSVLPCEERKGVSKHGSATPMKNTVKISDLSHSEYLKLKREYELLSSIIHNMPSFQEFIQE